MEVWQCHLCCASKFRVHHSPLSGKPSYDGVHGTPVFPSISALPGEVDLVILCLPVALVPESVRECSNRGISAVIVPSGGFREIGTAEGRRLEAELGSVVGSGVRVIGPNCFGVYSRPGV